LEAEGRTVRQNQCQKIEDLPSRSWSAMTVELCIGITNGSDVPMFSWLPLERDNWIADFRMDPIVCPDGRESLELTVEGYEPPPKGKDAHIYISHKPVLIELWRRKPDILMWKTLVSNAHLFGKPELKWSEREPRTMEGPNP
jgi:hypothetical protein